MARVLITGCSSGFGELAARELSQAGHFVYATMRGTAAKNSATAQVLGSLPGVKVLDMDVTSEESIDRAVTTVFADGQLDAVVHNAGIGVNGVAEASTPEQLAHVMDVNVLGVHRLNRAVLPHFRGCRSGLLIYVSSGLGRTVLPYLASYCASKFALEAYAEALAYEVATHGIDSVILQPGAYPSRFRANILDPDDPVRLAGYPVEQSEAMANHEATKEMLASEAAPDPREVTNAMLTVIEAPPGERPFRIAMRRNSGGLKMINQICGEVQNAMMRGMKYEHRLPKRPQL
ncbi:MAG: SDR family NAD(P)-dependent oxidoreductase [bacterium]|nr:SDR family NAD(P)-dependent oxidoreductase [bacterium]